MVGATVADTKCNGRAVLAGQLRDLLLDERDWVKRRVETIEFLGAETVRRRVSIDLAAPSEISESLCLDGEYWLPLATLRKAPLRNFDLKGPSGGPISAVTKAENGELAVEALLLHAADVLQANGLPVASAQLVRDLTVVATGDADEADDRLFLMERVAETGDAETSSLLADEDMMYLLERLAGNYVLLGVVTALPSRLVLKMSYDQGLEPARPTWRQRLGLAPLLFQVDTPGAARGASYHVEVVVPEELRIDAAFLFDTFTDRVYGMDQDADRAAVYAASVPRDGLPALLVGIRPERAGFPTLAATLAVLIACLLAVGALFASLDPEKSGAAVTVLLAGSALYSGAVARSGEHSLVRSLFILPRVLLAVSAASALAAAASLALHAQDDVIRWVWGAGALVSAVVATTLVMAFQKAAPSRHEGVRI